MSELQTSVTFPHIDPRISFQDQLVAMGSCFAQHMALRLHQHKAKIHAHPFGILFNPASIARSIKLIHQELSFADPILQDGMYYSLDAHGDIHAPTVNVLQNDLEERRAAAYDAWDAATHVCITFGTASVYEHKESGLIVANCHRLPTTEFERYLLSIEDIVEIWSEIIDEFSRKTFLLSVSPVRHIRDGLHENSLSKSVLHIALDQLCANHPNAHYVPSYEFFIDELRDYRFYARDMCHPSDVAIDLLWQRFVKTYTDYEMQETLDEIAEVVQAMQHKPRQPHSDAHRQFCEQFKAKVETLQQKFPDRDWSSELEAFLFQS